MTENEAEQPAGVGKGRTAGRRPRPGSRSRAGRLRAGRLVVAALVVVGGAWWAWQAGSDSGRTPGQAVSGFFEAQRTGDCERLIDVLTEGSWSQDGRLGRDEFLDRCADALVGYRAAVDGVDVEVVDDEGDPSDGGDRAIVRLPGRSSFDEGPEGTLVVEGGEWRVEADPEVLPIGRSVEDTLRGYVDAYNDADCERMLDYLAEATWSRDGALTGDQFLDRCATAVDGAQDRRPLVVTGVEVDRSGDEDDQVVADVTLGRWGDQPVDDLRPAAAMFVRDGLTWTFAGFATASGELAAGTGSLVPVFEVVELQDRLVDEIPRPEERCSYFRDHATTQPAGGHAGSSIRREFPGCFAGVDVSLYRFDDDGAARASAESMVAAGLADLPPTAEDLAGIEGVEDMADPADLERYAAGYRPNQEAPVPGIADALGLRTSCSVDGCSGASVFGIRDGVLVRIDVSYGDPDMADAAAILRAQLERI